MSQAATPSSVSTPATSAFRVRKRMTSLAARGEPMVWLTGGCVVFAAVMIVTLLVFILMQGFATFWPMPIEQVSFKQGETTRVIMGEPTRHDVYEFTEQVPVGASLVAGAEVMAVDEKAGLQTVRYYIPRTLYKVGNYDISGEDFVWVEDRNVLERSQPQWALIIERTGWGNAYGTLEATVIDGQRTEGAEAAWAKFNEVHPKMEALTAQVYEIEKHRMGEVSEEQDNLRLDLSVVRREHGEDSPEYTAKTAEFAARVAELDKQMAAMRVEAKTLRDQTATSALVIKTTSGAIVPADRTVPDAPMLIAQVVRAYPANALSFSEKMGVYVSRWYEFLTAEPREANAEGGVWPAIVGTVLLTFVMVIFVVPIGVIAALYLREYAKQGALVSFVRISVNNLAGVPSIVYGVFGLGFFCYMVGRYIDRGPETPMAIASWTGWALATLAVIGIASGLTVFLNIFTRESEKGLPGTALKVLVFGAWLGSVALVLLLVWTTPFFSGFFSARAAEGTPTLGKSAMIWASMTLAILTLPLVIVATEEALAAVPRSMREGSYACGASKWQTIRRIVLPRAMPGVMTGMILAIARGAGEVAPIMLVGAVKLAPELPISGSPGELFGLNRSFMHLGFHIFDLAFQSRNSMAALPMAYTTTFLLIVIVVLLNVAAIFIRSRLRKAYAGGAF